MRSRLNIEYFIVARDGGGTADYAGSLRRHAIEASSVPLPVPGLIVLRRLVSSGDIALTSARPGPPVVPLGKTMSKLAAALEKDRFVVTSELTPPKGTDLAPLLAKADALRDVVTAFNLTDSHAARMAMAPMAAARGLLEHGLEPIVQMTSRDRNRLALQGDMLGAHALGVRNLVFMGGDPPANGDHPEAKAVFDLPSAALLRAASALGRGEDLMGNALSGAADFLLGAVVNPGAADLEGEIRRLEEKREAGARFFQTQAVYDIGAYERFIEATRDLDLCLLTGIIPLKSPKMAEYMNTRVPGICIPDALIKEIGDASERRAASVEIAARIVREVRPMARGVHIMAIGWEDLIPEIVARADI